VLLHSRKQDYIGAKAEYRAAIKFDPTLLKARTNLSSLLTAETQAGLRCVAPASMRPCDYCATTSEVLVRCSKCKAVRYCGRVYQRAHWKTGHNHACCGLRGTTKH
jgi:hypothetical protein